MYCESKIHERLTLAAKELGFMPQYHSVEEVESFERQMKARGRYVLDDTGVPVGLGKITPAESQYMQGEIALCMSDSAYALSRYAYVKNEENNIVRFRFRVPQIIIFKIIADLEELGGAIEIQFLKARQVGTSTMIELMIGQRVVWGYGVTSIIGSADQKKTKKMSNMLFLFYDQLPFWIKPIATGRSESATGYLNFGKTHSGIDFQHGAQVSGIARGDTPTVTHLSECSSFTNPETQIEASLFKAVHASPSVFTILESTGEGDTGWWADTWRSSVSNWDSGGSRLCPKFLPWFVGVDIWPTPTWARTHPVPQTWHPNNDTAEHVAKAELYVQTDKLLEKELIQYYTDIGKQDGPKWKMPRVQQYFWEIEHEESKRKKLESLFFQEMAGDADEALQRSAISAFGYEVIEMVTEARAHNYKAYGLKGQSIEERHEPDARDIDYDKERIVTKFVSPRGDKYKWELVPLKFNIEERERDEEGANGVLLAFHEPEPGVSYSIGVDTAEGIEEDSTVISVWGVSNGESSDIQVAEFASNRVNHVEAFAFVMAIASWYGKYMAFGETMWDQPYVSIEQVQAVGDTCQLQMKKMGYHKFHAFKRYDGKVVSDAKSHKEGWYSFMWARPLLTGHYVHATQCGWLQINSPWLIHEMANWEKKVTKTKKEKLEHAEGEHDDRIFAAAMAVFCPQDLKVLAKRSSKRIVDPEARPPIDIGPYQGQTFSTRAMPEALYTTSGGLDIYDPAREALERY